MLKYLGCTVVILFSLHMLSMEDTQPKKELSLEEIIYFCKKSGNVELAEIYAENYDAIKIVDAHEKKHNHDLYVTQVRLYIESPDIYTNENPKYPVIFRDKANTCPICWCLCEHDITKLLCCSHKFHTRCLINWMATGNQKSCPICEKQLL